MKLLNLACGATRPGPPWVNLDMLHPELLTGTPERTNLDAEPNYIEHDLQKPLPFESGTFSGILASHLFEHFDAIECRELIAECHRVLAPGGILMVSVPDASYHRSVYDRDCKTNCLELFGETMPDSEAKQTFLEYALFFVVHRQVFTEDSLWATLVNGGFASAGIKRIDPVESTGLFLDEPAAEMHSKLNRRMFSLVMVGTKPTTEITK